jgi:hypothetical protein
MKKKMFFALLAACLFCSVGRVQAQSGLLYGMGDVIDGETLDYALWPRINDSRELVFQGGVGDSENMYYADLISDYATPIVRPGDQVGDFVLNRVVWPDINDAGDVVFKGEYNDPIEESSGIFLRDSLTDTVECLAATGDVIGSVLLANVNSLAINDTDDVIFSGGYYEGDVMKSAIFHIDLATRESRILVRLGDSVDGFVLDYIGKIDLNDSGDVVFYAYRVEDTDCFFHLNLQEDIATALLARGASVGEHTLDSIAWPALNDLGELIFIGTVGGVYGCWQTDLFGGPIEGVAAMGDVVGEHAMFFVDMPSKNNLGDLAFFGASDLNFAGVFLLEGLAPPSPEEMLEELITLLPELGLSRGLANVLNAKLTGVLNSVTASNAQKRNDALNKLQAILNSVDAQRGKKIDEPTADLLADVILAIITEIERTSQ